MIERKKYLEKLINKKENGLIYREFNVDVGVIEYFYKGEDKKSKS